MSRRLLAAPVIAVPILALTASSVSAHAISGSYPLPVPLWLYLGGAASAVAASFVVAVVVIQPPPPMPSYSMRPLPAALATVGGGALRLVGLAGWSAVIVCGLLSLPNSLLASVLFWVFVWVALPIVSVVLGNPWPSLSPFRTMADGIDWLAARRGRTRPDAGWSYPAGLERWPAVMLLFGVFLAELVLGPQDAWAVGILALGYTLFTLIGMLLLGRVAWLRNVELFEQILGWFGRVGPIGRRSVSADLCAECEEHCQAERCVDCPECTAAAARAEQRTMARPWFVGLADVRRGGWSDAALILLLLAGATFDGLQETGAWVAVGSALFVALAPVLGSGADAIIDMLGLLASWLALLAIFGLAAEAARRLAHRDDELGSVAGAYAATLLPIAAGYLIAHYLTIVIQGVVWLPELRETKQSITPDLTWLAPSVVWYFSVGAIVLGHVAAVVLAHRQSLRDRAAGAMLAGAPLVALMVVYTVLSLWIIGQPITVDPR